MDLEQSKQILESAPAFNTENVQSTKDTVDITEIRQQLASKEGKAYWRSLEELAETEEFQEFLHKEFPQQAAPLEKGLDRREFIKLLGASLALGGLSACVRPNPQEKIVPYVKAPEEIIPGKPVLYASALTTGGFATGVIVENHNGRPTRLEGNPDHPASLGAIAAQSTAEILTLYDPERSRKITNKGQESSWEDFTEFLAQKLAFLEDGKGLRILTETVTSPSLASQLDQLLGKFPAAKWHQFSSVNFDNVLTGAELAFNEVATPIYHLEEAEIILSLDSDFLGNGPAQLHYARAFATARRVHTAEDNMNRLYVAEPTPTNTGTMADHRLPIATAQIEALTRNLAHELGIEVTEVPDIDLPESWLETLAKDLKEHSGVVIVGEGQPAIVHALAHAINEKIGAVGKYITYHEPVIAKPENQAQSIRELASDMQAGTVDTLIILGGNPCYNAPAELNFKTALKKVATVVHSGLYYDETATEATWHVPQTHELETWADARAFNGAVNIMQPQLKPLYGGKSALEIISALLAENQSAYEVVSEFWKKNTKDFDLFWKAALYHGVIEGTEVAEKEVSLNPECLLEPATATKKGLEILFRADPNIGDGKLTNNGWMQELPKPFSKLTWDNAALISPALAERENLKNQDVVILTANHKTVEIPVWIVPGQAENTITLHLGYGRNQAGKVGNGTGFDVYPARNGDNLWFADDVHLIKTEKSYQLASTQTHHALESDGIKNRHLVRSGTLAEFKAHPEHPEFVHPVKHPESDLYTGEDHPYESYAWGMVIDQNVCTGCNACITACQSENNIPIVGKQQVSVGREMQWIRVDAYYGGDLDNPEYFNLPVACAHCEQAPCEPVCPVGATVHDSEGLNVMVYNRCVGTRYCSNNCPYKVRRFNFLQYAELQENSLALLQNPDVTVRSRGVMEKCTYCIQRIQQSYITSENEQRPIFDGEIKTACESACPTEAIVFGDVNAKTIDKEAFVNSEGKEQTAASHVKDVKDSALNYTLLEELNILPRTSYLTKLFNLNPNLAEAHSTEDSTENTHG